MKLNEVDIREVERLAEAWPVEMPGEGFFVNLPAVLAEKAMEKPRPWWQPLLLPAGAVGCMLALLFTGSLVAGRQAASGNRLAQAAVNWSVEDIGWEDIDEALADAEAAGVTDLYRYFDNAGLEEAASAFDATVYDSYIGEPFPQATEI